MKTRYYHDVFEEVFADKVQTYKAEVAEARAETALVNDKYQEAENRNKYLEELFFSTMNDAICEALCNSGKVKNVPHDVELELKQIKSYPFLRRLLSVATSLKTDYPTFLTTLNEYENQENDSVI